MIDSNPESDREEAEEDQTPRDPFLNPFRVPKGDNVKAIITDVLNQVQNFESYRRLRKRRRRANDQMNFEAAVTVVVCDLIHHHLVADGDIAISLSKEQLGRGSRYDGPTSTNTLPTMLDLLATSEMAFLEKRRGEKGNPFRRGRCTTIRAGELRTDSARYREDILRCQGRRDFCHICPTASSAFRRYRGTVPTSILCGDLRLAPRDTKGKM
ncbi:MAG TPA: hypothetical protein VGK75_09465 [Casimicrobiaceae bacterium]